MLVCNVIYSVESGPYIKLLNIYGTDFSPLLQENKSVPIPCPTGAKWRYESLSLLQCVLAINKHAYLYDIVIKRAYFYIVYKIKFNPLNIDFFLDKRMFFAIFIFIVPFYCWKRKIIFEKLYDLNARNNRRH